MSNRLWTNPPLKSDGSLDYAQLTLAEICEDLTESLMDRVVNGGLSELAPYLEELPEATELPEVAPSERLVKIMEGLLKHEEQDVHFQSPESQRLIGDAVQELKQLTP